MKTKHKIAIAGALSRVVRRVGGDHAMICERGGITWELDLSEGIDFAIFLLGAFERATIRAYSRELRAGDVVLDAGANIGAHTLHFARLVGPNGRVFAFEPTAFAFEKLRRNIALNPELGALITTEQLMLVGRTDQPLRSEIYSSWPLGKAPAMHPQHRGVLRGTEGARATTLDDYVAGASLSRVDLLKIDVDGHECDVLRGASRVLRELRPKILIELAPYLLEPHGASLEELCAIFREHGYALTEERSGTKLELDPAKLRARIPEGSSINALARAHVEGA